MKSSVNSVKRKESFILHEMISSILSIFHEHIVSLHSGQLQLSDLGPFLLSYVSSIPNHIQELIIFELLDLTHTHQRTRFAQQNHGFF